jgi:hypothetical protein
MSLFEFQCVACEIYCEVESRGVPVGVQCPDCGHEKLHLLAYQSDQAKELNLGMQKSDHEARLTAIETFLEENLEGFQRDRVGGEQ